MWKEARYYRKGDGIVEDLGGVFITETGIVKNVNRDKRKGELVSIQTNKGGYKYVRVNGKNYLLHLLVISTFSECPKEKGYQVDHIDKDKMNNILSNLRFVTPSQNQRNKNKYTKPKIFLILKKTDLSILEIYSSEQMTKHQQNYVTRKRLINIDKNKISLSISSRLYDKINDSNYPYLTLDSIISANYVEIPENNKIKISKSGVLRREFNYGFHYTLGTYHKGYYIHTLKLPKGYSVFVHGLIINIFNNNLFDSTKFVIDHINTDSEDNRLDNLKIVTQKENINNENSLEKIRTPLKCNNRGITRYFKGLSECAKIIGLNHPGSICDWLKGRYKCSLKNFSDFQYLTEDELKNINSITFTENSDEITP